MEKKHALLSKTIWVNLLMAVAAILSIYVPAIKEVVTSENLVLVFSVINMVLRAVTKGEIFFKDS